MSPNGDFEIFVVIHAGHGLAGPQHALVLQKADREIFGVIPDRHGRHDLLAVEEDRQWPFFDDCGLDRRAGFVESRETAGQPAVLRIRGDDIVM